MPIAFCVMALKQSPMATILKEPATAGVAWTEKHQGKTHKAAYNKIFEDNKKDNLFPANVPGLRHLHTYYGHFCELATHTSVTSIGKSFKDLSTKGHSVGDLNTLKQTLNG